MKTYQCVQSKVKCIYPLNDSFLIEIVLGSCRTKSQPLRIRSLTPLDPCHMDGVRSLCMHFSEMDVSLFDQY